MTQRITQRSLSRVLAFGLLSALPLSACSESAGPQGAAGSGGATGAGGGLSGLDGGDEAPLPELPAVAPRAETEPVKGFGDAADDPAIWVNPNDPTQSLIFATDKTASGGLFVYDLEGKQRDFLPLGELNNVDLRAGFTLGEREVTLITATNRTTDTLVILALDHDTLELSDVSKGAVATAPGSYGLCMYKSPSGKLYSIVNSTDGTFQQFELTAQGEQVSAALVRSFCTETQPEGCVADDAHQRLFVGEEGFGVWVFPAEDDAPATGDEEPACEGAIAGAQIASTLDGDLARDVEGMAIAATSADAGYLFVSAQGKHEFVAFDRMPPYEKRFAFAVWGGGAACIDGVEETDGLDVTSANLGPLYPGGLFVVQDGFNGDPVAKQNFKLVALDEVLEAAEPNAEFVGNAECRLGDYGGKARFADLPPGPERTEEFCQTFCGLCARCYSEGDAGFSEGDCHYKSGKPNFIEADCLEGCAVGANPADTRALTEGWESWECLDVDDAL